MYHLKKKFAACRDSYLSYAVMTFGLYFSMSIFASILSVYLTGIGKTPEELSFIVSSSGLFGIVLTPVIGYLNDRVKYPKRLIYTVLGAVGVLALVFAFVGQTWALFVLNGVIVTGITSVSPILERVIGNCRYQYGRIRLWGTLGYAAASLFGGFVLQYFPPLLLFVLTFIATVVTMVGVRSIGDIAPPQGAQEKQEKGKLTDLLRSPHLLLFFGIAFLYFGTTSAHNTYIPILLEEMGIPLSMVGTVLFAGTVVEIPVLFFAHKFMDRFSCRQLLLVANLLQLLSFLCYALIPNAVVVVGVVLLLISLPSMIFMMLNLKIITNLTTVKTTSTALGISASCMAVGKIALLNLGGVVAGNIGITGAYLLLSGVMLLCLILSLFLKVPVGRNLFGKSE